MLEAEVFNSGQYHYYTYDLETKRWTGNKTSPQDMGQNWVASYTTRVYASNKELDYINKNFENISKRYFFKYDERAREHSWFGDNAKFIVANI